MKKVSVFGSSQTRPEEKDYQDAMKLGRAIAERRWAVVNGGYGGLMEAVSAGAAQINGEVIGVTVPAVFADRAGANPFVTREEEAPDLVARIRTMLHLSDAAIALPGSIGTLTELLMAWNLSFVSAFSDSLPIPIVAVGPTWRRLVPLITQEVETDGTLVECVDGIDAALAVMDARLAQDAGT